MMEQTIDNVEVGTPKRPVFLTVLCILSFIAAGIGIIGMLLVGGVRGAADATGVNMQEAIGTSTPGVDTAAVDAAQAVMSWPYIITAMLLILIGLFGVIQMWKLKKTGFYMYTFAQVAGIIVPIVFGMTFPVFGTVMAIAFIVMYGVNLKAMR